MLIDPRSFQTTEDEAPLHYDLPLSKRGYLTPSNYQTHTIPELHSPSSDTMVCAPSHQTEGLSRGFEDSSTIGEIRGPLLSHHYAPPREVSQELSPFFGAISFAAAAVGTGVAAMPYYFRLATTIGGLIMMTNFSLLSLLAMISITNVTASTRAVSYSDLGKKGIRNIYLRVLLVEAPLLSLTMGAISSYIVIAAGICDTYLSSIFSSLATKLLVTALMAIICLVRSFGEMKFFASFSGLAFTMIVVTFAVVSYKLSAHIPPAPPAKFVSFNLILASPIAMMCLHGHSCVPSVYSELKPGSKRSAGIMSIFAILIVAVITSAAGLLPALVFKANTLPDFMWQLSETSKKVYGEVIPLVILAQVLLGVTIICKTPLIFQPIKECLMGMFGLRLESSTAMMNITTTFASFFVCSLCAIFLNRLDIIIQLFGSVAAIPSILLFPGTLTLLNEKGYIATSRGILLVVTGVLLTTASLYVYVIQVFECYTVV